jgi:uncharacterized protein YndB with AHSA1/START domain
MFPISVRRTMLLCGAFAAAATMSGDVLDAADNGFTVSNTVMVSAPPDKAYAAMVQDVGKWWDSAHTFSQTAANLSIDAKPQGCWCEKLPGQGGVRHLTVVYVSPGKAIGFEGGLGPLQTMGAAGSMTWKFQPAENGTKVEIRYAVGGYKPGGFKDLAPIVDSMLRSQLERYKRYSDTGKP